MNKATHRSRAEWVRQALTAAALSAVVTLGGMTVPMPAFAVTYGTGTLTISQSHNAQATYDGYRVFRAVVNTEDKATDIVWENDVTKRVVLAYLDGQGYSSWLTSNNHTEAINGIPAHDIAQNAAEFISEKVQSSATDTDANTTPRSTVGSSFASGLARALVTASTASTDAIAKVSGTPVSTGQQFSGTEGYYLFVTTASTIGDNEAGTAPIWVALSSAKSKTIAEKSAIPSLVKTVREDSNNTYGLWSDANRDQGIQYRLEGSVAQNVQSYAKYYYQFVDSMQGLEMNTAELSGVVIKVNGEDVTQAVKSQVGNNAITFSGGTLTVTINDLLDLGKTITKDTKVIVEYTAHLNDSSRIGGDGNPNTAYVRYSSNPAVATNPSSSSDKPDSVNSSTDKTPDQTVRAFTFALEILKVDQDTREALPGAKFTLQVANSSTDADSRGKYVQANGSLSTTEYEFTTDGSGKINVPRIDEGVYTLHEKTPPTQHKALAQDVTITVGRSYDNSGTLSGLTAQVSGGNGLFVSSPNAYQDGIVSAVYTDGKVSLRVSDKLETYLPGTGLTMTQAGVAFGSVCVVIGLVGIIRYRKRRTDDGESD